MLTKNFQMGSIFDIYSRKTYQKFFFTANGMESRCYTYTHSELLDDLVATIKNFKLTKILDLFRRKFQFSRYFLQNIDH